MYSGGYTLMVIIVTGGIGSGKSMVCRMIREIYGFPVYEADSRAKELYVRYPELLEAIESALSCSVRDSRGVFQPRLLAGRIFADKEALAVVESLLFPFMMSDFQEYAENSGNIIIFESATVLEKPQFDGFGDKVILVDAPRETRIDRACARDGLSREAVLARMDAQKLMNALSDGAACARIDETIMNDGSADDLLEAVKDVMERLLAGNNKQ